MKKCFSIKLKLFNHLEDMKINPNYKVSTTIVLNTCQLRTVTRNIKNCTDKKNLLFNKYRCLSQQFRYFITPIIISRSSVALAKSENFETHTAPEWHLYNR